MYIVGIDIAKRSHEAIILTKDGEVLGKSFKFTNDPKGFEKLMDSMKKVSSDLSLFEIGMEATGHYWLNLYIKLKELDLVVHVINPIQSDALRNLYIRQTKNDSKDAFIIAEVIRFGRYSETTLAEPDLLVLRELSRQRFFLVDMIADLKRKVIALLDLVFPEYESIFSDTFSTTSLELLSQYTTPEEILSIDTDKLATIITKASKGRFSYEKAEQIRSVAQSSFGALMIADTLGLMVR